MVDLDALEALLGAGTPGPWEWAPSAALGDPRDWSAGYGSARGLVSSLGMKPWVVVPSGHEEVQVQPKDAELLVQGINALPSLLSELRAARRVCEAARIWAKKGCATADSECLGCGMPSEEDSDHIPVHAPGCPFAELESALAELGPDRKDGE